MAEEKRRRDKELKMQWPILNHTGSSKKAELIQEKDQISDAESQ